MIFRRLCCIALLATGGCGCSCMASRSAQVARSVMSPPMEMILNRHGSGRGMPRHTCWEMPMSDEVGPDEIEPDDTPRPRVGPRVGIVMGSDSDWPVMSAAGLALRE